MDTTHLSIAGLCWRLDSPHPLTIAPRMAPFVCAAAPADITVALTPCRTLPSPDEGGYTDGLCYHSGDGVWHHDPSNGNRYALTRFLPDGNIQLCYLPTAAEAFTGTGGVFNHIGIERPLLTHGGVVLHASLIRYRGRAIAFCAPSGAGKSTQATLWQQTMGADVLNGDRAALRRANGVWTAYGLPFAGTSGIYRNEQAPLVAVVVPGQAAENTLCPLTPTEALTALYPQTACLHREKALVEQAVDTLTALIAHLPVYRLDCRPDATAVALLHRTLTEGGIL